MKYLPCEERLSSSGQVPDAAVIWLHGLGADGHDFAGIVPQLHLPEGHAVRFLFPHAPTMPVSINNGYVMPAWYDIREMNLSRQIDEQQLRASAEAVYALIEREMERGIDSKRIVLGGFSQGGAVVLEAALSCKHPLAGVMSLSSYFPTADSVRISDANRKLPVLVCHGSYDPVVNESLGRAAAQTLKDLGYPLEYYSYAMEHSVCLEEIAEISRWLQRVLPIVA